MKALSLTLLFMGGSAMACLPDGTRIVQVDSSGEKAYHKQQFVVKQGRVYQIDRAGEILYHRGHLIIEKKNTGKKPSYTITK